MKALLVLALHTQAAIVTTSVDSVPVTLAARASGFVLGQLAGPVEPFYHASALLHTVITAKVGTNVEIPVRALAEVWNFSNYYGIGSTAIRPALHVTIRDAGLLDSITVLVGDLWRMKHGQGLVLDYFESQGGELAAYAQRWALQVRAIGMGWGVADDLYSVSLGFDSLIGVRYLDDSPDIPAYRGSQFLSVDVAPKVADLGRLYAEAGRNLDTRTWGGLVGARGGYARGRNHVTFSAEYRHYERSFFNNDSVGGFMNGGLVYPYYASLTALDKPLNTPHLYLQHRGQHNVAAARVRGRVYLKDWFLDADLEGLTGTVDLLAYDVAIGFAANPLADLSVGVLNKLFRFPTYAQSMFNVRDKAWPFMRASFRI
jgi:hypothetical protein